MLAASSGALAVVYKWVEEDGKVIYSNEPPSNPASVSELTRIDDLKLEARAEPSAAEKSSADTAVAVPEPVPGVTREPVTLIPREPVTLIPREPVTLIPKESPPPAQEAEAPPARVYPRSRHTGAVQDPCLLSADPKCHERNRGHYHPYLGYSPGEMSVGASSSAAAGGTVGGRVPAPQSTVVTPKRGSSALPPGSAPPSAIEWTRSSR